MSVVGPPAPEGSASSNATDRRRGRRLAGRLMIGAGILLLLSVGWVSFRAYQAYHHLQAASSEVSQLQRQISGADLLSGTALDAAGATSLAARLSADAGAAAAATHDPLYRIAGVIPWIGPNLRAVSDIAKSVDDIARGAVTPLLHLAGTLDASSLAPKGGAIDLAPLVAASGPAQTANTVMLAAQARMRNVDRNALVGPVANAVSQLSEKLDKVEPTVQSVARLLRLVPPMLGADGQRRYLLVFQNLAEARSTGGIFGSYAVVTVTDGKVVIAGQGAASRSLGPFNAPVEELGAAATGLYSDLMATDPQDVNFTPDFPTAAALFAKMYRTSSGQPVDAVVAVDPVAVSYMLTGTPAIDLGDGLTLTADNAAKVLLSDIYRKFPTGSDSPARDAFLARATAQVFGRLLGGQIPPRTILDGVEKAATQRRLMVWSSRPAEENDLRATAVGGQITPADNPLAPELGVFINDGTGTKLSFYLDRSIKVTPTTCTPDQRQTVQVAVVMHYGAPTAGLPEYVLGSGVSTVPPYTLRTNVLFFSPAGGQVSAVQADGVPLPMLSGGDHGRSVGVATVVQKPGSTVVVTATVTTARLDALPSGVAIHPEVVTTPGVGDTPVSKASFPVCGIRGPKT